MNSMIAPRFFTIQILYVKTRLAIGKQQAAQTKNAFIMTKTYVIHFGFFLGL